MFKQLQITRVSFIILSRNNNPSLLTPDFLRNNKIVKDDWVVDSTFTTDRVSQTVYENEFRIFMQPDRVLFEQFIEDGYSKDKFELKEVVYNFLEALPHINYTALGINPFGHIIFDSQEELDDYIFNHIILPGDWKKFNQQNPEISMVFKYPFEDYNIQVSIENVGVYETKKKTENLGVLFEGNIHREFDAQQKNEDRLQSLKNRVELWADDVDTYISLINDCFLKIDR